METPHSQSELDEIDQRLGDLWSMSEAEQNRASQIALAACIGFIVLFVAAACFVIFR